VPPPRKRFGQHFLTDRHALQRIADALQLTGTETVIEIGPGRGALTDLLVDRARRLVCIEVDRDLVAALRERYAERGHVEIVEGDVLTMDLGALAKGPFVLAGNVPYYITTPIIFHALTAPRPVRAVYLVQREVADRLTAQPGSKAYGALSVNVQALATVEFLGGVSAGAFYPKPKVESAIVRLTPRSEPLIGPEEEADFRAFVIALFGQRRRQLARALRTIANLDATVAHDVVIAAGLDPSMRAEDRHPSELVALARTFPKHETRRTRKGTDHTDHGSV
jgi:16S rRNA (adenine1518-N6/adenine1519-N6)-dimethyltransferase